LELGGLSGISNEIAYVRGITPLLFLAAARCASEGDVEGGPWIVGYGRKDESRDVG